MTGDPQVDHCIEVICQQGCRMVNQVIVAWDAGQTPAAAVLLDEAQQQVVLVELKAIMAVYAETGSCEI
jgi:hypothetical protein